ncbi:unnamed protein product [Notodromas monacha]|uniref:Mediator of RNA polymerase II transcription subunit 25 n=1 Tax=Notodromas monacha TaxID=399045 RepID=A0A7R9BG37_9CRUS|nr:unnamed protein product [Notodromas monacha]CAG0913219.1 unnamed protein product [Notodromas monacha]
MIPKTPGSSRSPTTQKLRTTSSSLLKEIRGLGHFLRVEQLVIRMRGMRYLGGGMDNVSHITEGLGVALSCYEEKDATKERDTNTIKHCVLMCNSLPYDSSASAAFPAFGGLDLESVLKSLKESDVRLSVISPRKIPTLLKIFEIGGGDVNIAQANSYAKDPRHLVLLNGYE